MKKIILATLVGISSLIADITLYNGMKFNSKEFFGLKEATPNDYALLPIKPSEKLGLKYKVAPNGEVLLYEKGLLKSVNISERTDKSLEEITKDLIKKFSKESFIGATIVEIDKKKGLVFKKKVKKINQLLHIFKKRNEKATENTILIATEAFKPKDKARTIVMYVNQYKKDKNCIKCDFIDPTQTTLKEESLLLKIYTK